VSKIYKEKGFDVVSRGPDSSSEVALKIHGGLVDHGCASMRNILYRRRTG